MSISLVLWTIGWLAAGIVIGALWGDVWRND